MYGGSGSGSFGIANAIIGIPAALWRGMALCHPILRQRCGIGIGAQEGRVWPKHPSCVWNQHGRLRVGLKTILRCGTEPALIWINFSCFCSDGEVAGA